MISAKPGGSVLCTGARCRAAIPVVEPRIAIVEGPDIAEPSAVAEALEMLVAWAMRACAQPQTGQRPTEAILVAPAAATRPPAPAYGPED